MWKKLVAGVIAAAAVVLLTLPTPALAGSARYPRYAGGWDRYGGPHCYRPPVRYYAPPVRYYAPPPPYYYKPYRPGVNVQLALPLPFFSVHIR
jgi:hypothetical protein